MKKSLLIIGMIGLMLCFPLSAGAKKGKNPKVHKHGIPQQINDLQEQINTIELTPGPQGEQGIQGETGATGAMGPQGVQGTTGATGAQGLQGVAGPIGPQGETGTIGPQGDTGATGSQGEIGAIGLQGDTGAQGIQGTTGATGTQGLQGVAGPQGPIGLTGADGAQGPQGDQGDTGAVGPQGPRGFTGSTGATGATGPRGYTGSPGDKGDPGVVPDMPGVEYSGDSYTSIPPTNAGHVRLFSMSMTVPKTGYVVLIGSGLVQTYTCSDRSSITYIGINTTPTVNAKVGSDYTMIDLWRMQVCGWRNIPFTIQKVVYYTKGTHTFSLDAQVLPQSNTLSTYIRNAKLTGMYFPIRY
jgi:hypothetical protein